MNYLNVYENGDAELSTHEYAGDEGKLKFCVYFDTSQDAKLALSIIKLYQAYTSPSARVDILEIEIAEQKDIIKRMVGRIDGLLEYQKTHMNYANAAVALLRRICNQLAVGTIAEATHRERNEVSRNIVNSIIYFLKSPLDRYNEAPQDMDDIPF